MSSLPLVKEAVRHALAAGYHVDETGRLISASGSVMRPVPDRNGYLRTTYRIAEKFGRKALHLYPHRLAAFQRFGDAYLFSSLEVRHLDNNKQNNRPINIAIGTHADNMQDQPPEQRARTAAIARRYAVRKRRRFSDQQVCDIVLDRALGMSYKQLGAKYNACKSTLSYLINKASYVERA